MFDSRGTQLRTIGEGMLKYPVGVCVDDSGRVYVAIYYNKSVVVMDGMGKELATIAVPGFPHGVAVTRRGEIVVSHFSPKGLMVVG